ncbi:MAG: PAS domain S-box protein, partial [bacterium]
MRLFALLSLISCAVFLYMGSFIYYQDRKSPLNRSFWWMCLFMSLWSFSEFMYRQAGSSDVAYFWIKVRALSWTLPLSFLLYFVLIFTEKKELLRHKALPFLVFAPALAFSIIDFSTDLLSGQLVSTYWGYASTSPRHSWVNWTSMIWTMGITLLAILLSLQYYLAVTDEKKKKQMKYILIGISVPILAGILTEIALPVFQIRLPELTNTSGIWLAIFVGYAIRKYELFTLSPAAASDNIISTMTDSLILMDPSGKIVTANKATLDLLGYEEREVIGQAADKVFGEEFGKSKVIEKVFAKGSITDQEMVLHPKKGGAISVIFSGSAIKNKEGRNIGFVGISKDITSRKRAEERALHQGAVLEGINKVFRETLRSETEEEVAKVCLGVAQELTGSKFGFIGEVNRAGRFDTIALSDPGWEACRMPKPDAAVMIRDMEIRGIWGKVLKEGQPLIANDPSSHPDRVGIPQGHSPLTSFLGVPLRHAGRTIGMIALANKESGYDLGDQQDIETLSVPFVEALSRKRAGETLRESEERYRAVVEQSPDGIYLTDVETKRIIEANPAFARMLGYTPKEMLELSVYDIVAADRGSIDERFQRILGTEGFFVYERQYRRKGGSLLDVWVSVNIISYRERKVMCTIARDLTEQKQAEEETRRHSDTQAVINSLLRRSLENVPPDELLMLALDLVLSIPWLSFQSRGCIFLVEEDPEALVMKAQNGLAKPIQKACGRVPFGRCLCGRAASTKEVQFSDCLDERHDITYEGIFPHGHYCVPILSA